MKCDCGGEAVNLPHYDWCSTLKPDFSGPVATKPVEPTPFDGYEYFVVMNSTARKLGERNAFFAKKMDDAFIGPTEYMFDGCQVQARTEIEQGYVEACCDHHQAELWNVEPSKFEEAMHRVLTIVRVNCPARCRPTILVNDDDWKKFEESLAKTQYLSREDAKPSPLDIEQFYAASRENQTAHFGYDYDEDTFACWCGGRIDTRLGPDDDGRLIDYRVAEFCTLHAHCPKKS